MKKIKGIMLVIMLIILCLLNSISYAYVPITEENLRDSLQKFVTSEGEEDYTVSVTSDEIILNKEEELHIVIKYDLTNKPTFTIEIPIEQGMSYTDYNEKTGSLILPMIGYTAVANIQGVEYEDASTYFLMSYLANAVNGPLLSEDSYIIVDDTNMTDEVTIDKDESDTKTIYVSEFGERVMELVNYLYKDKKTIKDSSDDINSYEWTFERTDITDISCKLVSTVTVNPEANFSKIKEAVEGIFDKAENIKDIQDIQKTEDVQKVVNNNSSTNITKIPYSGLEENKFTKVLVIVGIALVVALISAILKYRRNK